MYLVDGKKDYVLVLRGISLKTIKNMFVNTLNACKHYKIHALDIQQDIVHIQIVFRGRDTDNIWGRYAHIRMTYQHKIIGK